MNHRNLLPTVLWAVAIACCAGAPGLAAPAAPRLDRQAAVAYALAHNPSVLSVAAQMEAVRSRLTQADARPNPQLGLMAQGVNPADNSTLQLSLQLTQPLHLAGQRGLKKEMARTDLRHAERALEHARQEAIQTTKRAYNEILAARQELVLAVENVDWSRKLLETAQARTSLGEAALAEVLRAKLALAQAEQERADAEHALSVAVRQLQVAIGRMEPLEVERGGAYEVPLATLPPASELVPLALANRPEVAQGQADIRREELNERLAGAAVLPGFDLVAGAVQSGPVPGAITGINVDLPIWYRQEGEIAESRATQQSLRHVQTSLINGLVAQVEQACGQVGLAERRIRLHKEQILPNAKYLLELTAGRYRYGDASGFELQEARRAYRQAQLAYAGAYLEYRNALTDLEAAIGSDRFLPKE